MKCINTQSVDYIALLKMTGLMPYLLNALIRDYYEKYDDVPTVDRCLTIDYDTSLHLIKTYGLKKLGDKYTTKNKEMIDLVEINNIYRDLEVSVKQSTKGFPIIDIKLRALPNRTLQVESKETIIPTFLLNILELVAIGFDGTKYIYEDGGRFYISDLRISDKSLLKKLQSFDTQQDAENAKLEVKPKGLTGNIISAIIGNKNKLSSGYEIEVSTKQLLPSKFSVYPSFNYPKFLINPNLTEKSKIREGVIILNSLDDLEYNLLLALGISPETSQKIVDSLLEPVEYETIKTDTSSYVIRESGYELEVLMESTANSFIPEGENLKPMLDRLEELYGIKFKRVTNDEIRSSGLNRYVYDATQVNAFIFNGEIYINMDNAKADAPIHELSHLLLGSLRQTNPELYAQIVNSVEQYPEYAYELKKYKNRARMDANEEIFVDLFARHYAGLLKLDINLDVMDNVEYEIERNIDSAIFPNISTTNTPLSQLMGKSFLELMLTFGTVITKDNIAKAFDKSVNSRYVANIKESLFKSNALKEYCNG